MPDGAPHETLPQAVRTPPYRIGILGHVPGIPRSAKAAADFRLIFAEDAAQLEASDADFVLVDAVTGVKPATKPTFGIVHEASGLWDSSSRLDRLAQYDGYLTASRTLRRLLYGLYAEQGRQPSIGFFAATPPRQLLDCQIEKLSGLGAARLCHVGTWADRSGPLLQALCGSPYLRLYGTDLGQDGAPQEVAPPRVLSIGTETPCRIYAAFGAGLVTPAGDRLLDAGVLFRLCEIVSVGAVAVCPDIAWIRDLFGDTIDYYPDGDMPAALRAIGGAIERLRGEPSKAAARARAARAIFEQTLACEVMLQNAVDLFEEWRAGAGASHVPASDGTIVDTWPNAIGSLFERLSDKQLENLAHALATLRPLQPEPDWRFGGFGDSRDLAAHVRHAVWLAAKARGGTLPVTMPWHGGTRLKLVLGNDLSLTLFAGGTFEPNEFALLDRILQPGMVVLDGGANEGVYTVFAATRVGPKGRVIAVEPSSREQARLRANIALNRLRNVVVVEAALADSDGAVRLIVAEPAHAGQNTLGAFSYDGILTDGIEEVEAITLDALAERHALTQLDVLKLDLEGSELRALTGAPQLLAAMKPLILAEMSATALAHQGGTASAVCDLLEGAGYVIMAFERDTGLPAPRSSTGGLLSENIVAVHRDRDFGLLTTGG